MEWVGLSRGGEVFSCRLRMFLDWQYLLELFLAVQWLFADRAGMRLCGFSYRNGFWAENWCKRLVRLDKSCGSRRFRNRLLLLLLEKFLSVFWDELGRWRSCRGCWCSRLRENPRKRFICCGGWWHSRTSLSIKRLKWVLPYIRLSHSLGQLFHRSETWFECCTCWWFSHSWLFIELFV